MSVLCIHNIPSAECTSCSEAFRETVEQGITNVKEFIHAQCLCGADWTKTCIYCPPKRRENALRRYEHRMDKEHKRNPQYKFIEEAKGMGERIRKQQAKDIERMRQVFNAKYGTRLTFSEFKTQLIEQGKKMTRKAGLEPKQ